MRNKILASGFLSFLLKISVGSETFYSPIPTNSFTSELLHGKLAVVHH